MNTGFTKLLRPVTLSLVMVALAVGTLGIVTSCGTANNANGSDVEGATDEKLAPNAADANAADANAAPDDKTPVNADASKAVPADSPKSGGPCEKDEDCVAAACCHAATCVDKAQAPACDGMMCTRDCKPGTMDCGQGNCVCVDGQCGAQFKNSQIDVPPAGGDGARPE